MKMEKRRREEGEKTKETHLALAAALAIHGLSGLVGDAAGRQTVDTDLWSRHCSGKGLRDLGGHSEAVAQQARSMVWRAAGRCALDGRVKGTHTPPMHGVRCKFKLRPLAVGTGRGGGVVCGARTARLDARECARPRRHDSATGTSQAEPLGGRLGARVMAISGHLRAAVQRNRWAEQGARGLCAVAVRAIPCGRGAPASAERYRA